MRTLDARATSTIGRAGGHRTLLTRAGSVGLGFVTAGKWAAGTNYGAFANTTGASGSHIVWSGWINRQTLSPNLILWETSSNYNTTTGALSITFNSAGSLQAATRTGAGYETAIYSAINFFEDWNHIAFYWDYDAETIRMWLNGVEVFPSIASATSWPAAHPDRSVFIGNRDSASFAAQTIMADVRIRIDSSALSDAVIEGFYTDMTPSAQDWAFIAFDDGGGLTARDSSGNSNDVTLNNIDLEDFWSGRHPNSP